MKTASLLLLFVWLVFAASAATYTVTNSGDADSSGTLRWAINQANGDTVADTIAFNLSAPYTISPTGVLPTVTETVMIDGGTQPGYSGIPRVCIDGGETINDGLILRGIGTTVRGIRVSSFTEVGLFFYISSNGVVQACDIMSNGTYGIWVYMSPNTLIGGEDSTNRNLISANSGTGVYLHNQNTTNNRVVGNFIGITRDGQSIAANAYGVEIVTCDHNTIGGSNAGSRNVISGNARGINLDNGADRNVVIGNYIGIDVTGTNALPNSTLGISIYGEGNRIGGATDAERNIISGNTSYGLYFYDKAAFSNVVVGNYIGTDATGTSALPNEYGIYGNEAPRNFIGGTHTGELNIISGNGNYGIYLSRTSHSYVIQGNYIGVDVTGLSVLSNDNSGLRIFSPSNTIGGTSTGARNIISGGGSQGIWLENDAYHNVIQGNYIGTDATGLNAIPNGTGIEVEGKYNEIGGSGAGEGNLISGNNNQGIFFSSIAASNVVKGNYIGVDASGMNALSNYVGISVASAFNEIGGVSGGRNIISGNERTGISVSGTNAYGNRILGNYIGLGTNGITPISNLLYGVSFFEVSSNRLGTMEAGNVISGNDVGARIFGNLKVCVGNILEGNYIGTDYTGSNAVGNRIGLYLSGAVENHIGMRTNTASNLISGNRDHGIYIIKSTGNVIQANYIGTDISGCYALGNEGDGVRIDYLSVANYIGGATNGDGNLICGNGDDGVEIRDSTSRENYVWGNRIGLGAATNDLGNSGNGVTIVNGASFNRIGGQWLSGWPANQIAYNRHAGIMIDATSVSNMILMNSIFENVGLGIDLNNDGVTANDDKDPDPGANLLQNYAVITSITNSGGWLYVQGYLNSRPSHLYHLEFFANQECDPTGYGEGEFFASDMDDLLTDGNGDAWFTNQFGQPIPPPNYVTVLVTDQNTFDTSEFSYRYFIDRDGDGLGDGYEYTHWGDATSGVATADSDGDGLNNLEEFHADTNPKDFSSCLAIELITRVGDEAEIRIGSTSINRYYDFQYLWNTNLAAPSSWSDLIWNRQGVAGTMVFTTETAVARRFYRISTESP